ncbi:MAG: hypothetical protein HY318_18810, partial [Armatimonadetes bacterium]|nr:hypothetical protein [Armatimonadota bacterium]
MFQHSRLVSQSRAYGCTRWVCSRVLLIFLMLGATSKQCLGLSPGIRWWEPYTPSEGTLGLWHFDGKDRDLPTDAAAHSARAEVAGEVGGTTEGRFDSALAINGRPGAMKVVLKDPLPGTSRLSAEAWVYLDRYPETEGCLLFHPRVPGKQNELSLLIDHQGRVVMRWLRHNAAANAESLTVATAPNAVPVGTRTHVAGIFRWDTKASIHINGAEKASRLFQNLWGVQDGLPAEASAGPIWIGNNDALTKPWPGKIDELRISSDMLQLFPRSDNAWTDPESHRPLKRGKPFTPDDAEVLLHASFDNGTDADLARGEGKAEPLPNWYGLPQSALQPGVRGQAARYGASFQQKGNINLKEGTLEFWFQPLNWTNIHSYHVSVFNGPFMIYILNTGVVWPGGVPLVTWFNDKTYLRFGGVFAPEEWRHVVMSWKGQEVSAYLDGERVNTGGPSAGTLEQVAGPWPMTLGGNNAYDELYIYSRMLSDEEVANCYWRYRDPAKVKPLPAIDWRASYLVGVECLKATVDATRRPEVRKLRHEVLATNGKRVWQGQPQPLPSAGQEIVEKLPRLADGIFMLRADFLDAKGRSIFRSSRPFTVKHFPWEHNDIGKKPIIIPPYAPITIDRHHLKPWGRDILLDDTGLPEQIDVLGKPLLAAPIRLEGKQGEAEFMFTGSKVNVKDVSGFKVLNSDDYTRGPLTGATPPLKLAPSPGYQARTLSEGRLGTLKAKVSGTLDIDGWYQVKITLSADKPTTLDQLDLVCDLAPEADTLYAQTSDTSQDPNGYVNSSGEFGEIKREIGEAWNSKVLRTSARWKTFVPQVFVGTGERGLWWLAESDEGWVQGDDQPCVRIERLNDRVRLRIRIIGAATTIAAQRTIEFALLPEPVKPRPYRWRELAWCRGDASKNYYTHDTCGYRYYGD